MPLKDPRKIAQRACAVLDGDLPQLIKIDQYEQGEQPMPFMPDNADAEYKLLANRAVTNVMQFIISTPAQMMFVDSFRRGRTSEKQPVAEARTQAVQPEWDHFQKSGFDKKQAAVYRGALKFGHAFVVTETDKKTGEARSRGLSAMSTVALYVDAANDDDPYVALHVTRWPDTEAGVEVGLAEMWDDTYRYPVTFKSLDDKESIRVGAGRRHGASVCPVTRFTAAVDLEGRTCGVVAPMFRLQDRINQTVFDLLIVQSYASFKVRTIAGMAPPIQMRPLDADGNEVTDFENHQDDIVRWVPRLDKNGKPIPDAINLNAKRLFFAEDHDTKFDTLDETPLDGFIKAIELGFRHMAALSQTPPHHILGEISNLSAEALEAAETSLARKVDEFKTSFGESWERVFRIAVELDSTEAAADFAGETIWRDTGMTALSQTADALSKMREGLGIPAKGLWKRVPNVSAVELAEWEELADEENAEAALAAGTRRGVSSSRPTFRLTDAGDSPADAAA